MSNQQKRQSVNRRVGPPSTRGRDEVPETLLWAIKINCSSFHFFNA